MTSRSAAMLGTFLVPVIAAAMLLAPMAAPPPETHVFSFETDMEGWTVGPADGSWGNCTGSAYGNCSAGGSVERTTDLARDGSVSLRMSLVQGEVWIERPFNVTPDRAYRLTFDFAFATADNASAAPWSLAACGRSTPPDTLASLPPTCRGDTAMASAAEGFVWLEKWYTSIVTSEANGRIWAVLGVSAASGGPRTYYVDAVIVSLAAA